ncbi:MAG: dolichyl-phosphate beta-glucosyltransferase, partial [Acidobacteriota bacterium]
MARPYISVVIPSYNEMVNLRKGVLDKVEHFLSKQNYEWEVIVVDDGSTDGSREFVGNFINSNSSFRLIAGKHKGKVGAVTQGMLEAKGKYRLFTDMDQATPIEEIDKFLPYFDSKYDIVIGSRTTRKGAPWTRMLMSQGMIVLRSIIVGLPGIKDTQCGFKAFTQEAAEELFSEMKKIHNGFEDVSGSSVDAGFDVELLLLAQRRGFSIKEVPVDWLYVET